MSEQLQFIFFFKLWTILIFSELKKKKKNLLCFVLSSLSTPLSSSSVFHTLARSLASSFRPHSSLMKNAFPRCAHKGITWDSLKALLVLPACKNEATFCTIFFYRQVIKDLLLWPKRSLPRPRCESPAPPQFFIGSSAPLLGTF